MDVWQKTLTEFRQDIEARSMPGSGAVASVSAADGLALVLKGLRLSGSSNDRSDHSDDLIRRGDALIQRFEKLANEDVAAFQAFLQSQDKLNDTHRDTARWRIVQVPLDTAYACIESLELSFDAFSYTKPSLESDIKAGAILLRAALQMMLFNIADNMSELSAGRKDGFADEYNALKSRGDDLISAFERESRSDRQHIFFES